jgi:hypothetical protein
MFTHYNKSDGCEWRRGRLSDFVDHYNNLNGSAYASGYPSMIMKLGYDCLFGRVFEN